MLTPIRQMFDGLQTKMTLAPNPYLRGRFEKSLLKIYSGAETNPMIYAHLVGLGGLYHLYLTSFDPISLFAGGFEQSGAARIEDGEWLLNLPWIAHTMNTFGPAGDYEPLMLDEGFEPVRLSELPKGG